MGLADRDYMRARARSRGHARTQASRHAAGRDRIVAIARVAIPVLCLLTYLVPMYGDMKRGGWMPDWKPALPFPESGSVTAARDLSRKRVSSHLAVQTSDANAVVQLFDPDTGAHALSIYVAGNDRVEVPSREASGGCGSSRAASGTVPPTISARTRRTRRSST